jgi:hypothetical protein
VVRRYIRATARTALWSVFRHDRAHRPQGPGFGRTRGRCEALEVHEEQGRFVLPVADYLAMCDTAEWERPESVGKPSV